MPRVTQRKAQQDYPEQGIKKGDLYYSWAFFRQPLMRSKTAPTREQLTQNETILRVYALQNSASTQLNGASTLSELEEIVSSLSSEISEIASEEESKLDDMNEGMKASQVGSDMQERVDAYNQAASDLDSMDFSAEEDEDEEAAVARLADEARGFIDDIA